MKVFLSIILIFLSLLFLSKEESEKKIFHLITSELQNGTAAIVNLEDIPSDSDFIYFTFDFNYHSKNVIMSKFDTYFKISTEKFEISEKLEKNKNIISYGLAQQEWTDFKEEDDLEKKVIMWRRPKFLLEKKNENNQIDYYIQVKKIFSTDKTLIFKIQKKDVKEGEIIIENLINIPTDIKNIIASQNSNPYIKDNQINTINSYNKGNNKHIDYRNYQNNNNDDIKKNEIKNYYDKTNRIDKSHEHEIYEHHKHHEHLGPHEHFNYNYNHKYYNNEDYNRYKKYRRHHRNEVTVGGIWLAIGCFFLQIWLVIMLLYCLVNKKKKYNNGLAVVVNRIQNSQEMNSIK